jgi:DNA-directed RNA polymerase specialized sigma24 family protein
MKTPKNMTEEEVMEKIEKVINRISPKYAFYGYSIEDMKQESFLICMDALDRYDEKRPLENFLSVNLSNRLKNFVRDNHFLADEEQKAKITQPGQLENDHTIVDQEEKFTIPEYSIDYSDIVELLNAEIPASIRMDYLKVVHEIPLSKNRRLEVMSYINYILQSYGYLEETNEEG